MRQILVSFAVVGPNESEHLVIVSQEIITNKKNVIIAARKVFTLDTIDGEGVSLCDNQRSFMTNKKVILRVVGHALVNPRRIAG